MVKVKVDNLHIFQGRNKGKLRHSKDDGEKDIHSMDTHDYHDDTCMYACERRAQSARGASEEEIHEIKLL